MKKILERGQYKQAKECQTCGKLFTIRKKWKHNFDEVLYCSERCRRSK
ncbi:DUF2256 domain-containing protein [Candidatus Gracilibacteria bacterium]|nr:DUF2256 domain-containing protein [Candidatus Gracilibacteria bacterium]